MITTKIFTADGKTLLFPDELEQLTGYDIFYEISKKLKKYSFPSTLDFSQLSGITCHLEQFSKRPNDPNYFVLHNHGNGKIYIMRVHYEGKDYSMTGW